MWKSVLWYLNCNSPAHGELSVTESAQSQGEMCYPQIWSRAVWSHCRRLGHTLFFDFQQYLNPWYLLPFSQSCVLCGLGEDLALRKVLGVCSWASPDWEQHGHVHAVLSLSCGALLSCISLCFVFRLKVILAFQLELAHVWSALEQMCGCLGRWESAHQEVSIWQQHAFTSCTARNEVYFRKAKAHFRSGSRTEKMDTSLHSRACVVFLADHTRSTSTFQCLLLYFQNQA